MAGTASPVSRNRLRDDFLLDLGIGFLSFCRFCGLAEGGSQRDAENNGPDYAFHGAAQCTAGAKGCRSSRFREKSGYGALQITWLFLPKSWIEAADVRLVSPVGYKRLSLPNDALYPSLSKRITEGAGAIETSRLLAPSYSPNATSKPL
jgi:hypothetical protein